MKLVVANWKMNGDWRLTHELLDVYKSIADKKNFIFCPPATYLMNIRSIQPDILLGGQDCSAMEKGAFTGEISALHLRDAGCQYVIVGHSECRKHRTETDETVNEKAKRAISAGLIPIICIGEDESTYKENKTLDFIKQTLLASTQDLTNSFIIAYEPVWAIGTGLVPKISEISEVHSLISEIIPHTKVLYGGSVSSKNVLSILEIENVDGCLVGGASLDLAELRTLLRCADLI